MKEVSTEKLAEIQKELNELCEKHGVKLQVAQKFEIVVLPKEEEK